MDTTVEILKLPDNDRNIRLTEYHPDLFRMKPPYEIIIEISLFSGRTDDTKRQLYRTLVDRLATAGYFSKDAVFILLIEEPPVNRGVRGGVPASEINLGFKTDV